MKAAISWILVGALLAGGVYFYITGKQKDADIERLKQENQEIPQLRAENEELKKRPDNAEEVARLRKDNEDLLRLRNEVKQLRAQAKLLDGQLQTAQAQQSQAQQQLQQLSQTAAENAALRTQAQQIQKANNIAQAQQCSLNLRQIEAAKQQWAADPKKTGGPTPTVADLAPYLGNKFPVCPSGGSYTINMPGTTATCSTPGHGQQ
jgi:hypothetical protein